MDKVLDAVDRMVASAGADSVTMTALTRQAKVAPATVYQYFRNTDDILIAAHDRMLSRMTVDLTDRVTRIDVLDSHSIEAMIRGFVDAAREHSGYTALLKFSYLHKTTRHSGITVADHIGHLVSLYISVWAPNIDLRHAVVTRTVVVHILTIMTNLLLLEHDRQVQELYLRQMVKHCKFALERASLRDVG